MHRYRRGGKPGSLIGGKIREIFFDIIMGMVAIQVKFLIHTCEEICRALPTHYLNMGRMGRYFSRIC